MVPVPDRGVGALNCAHWESVSCYGDASLFVHVAQNHPRAIHTNC